MKSLATGSACCSYCTIIIKMCLKSSHFVHISVRLSAKLLFYSLAVCQRQQIISFFIEELKRLLKPSPGASIVQRLRSFVIFLCCTAFREGVFSSNELIFNFTFEGTCHQNTTPFFRLSFRYTISNACRCGKGVWFRGNPENFNFHIFPKFELTLKFY